MDFIALKGTPNDIDPAITPYPTTTTNTALNNLIACDAK